jgi:hypothetical protein
MNILKKWIVLCWNIRGLNAKSKQLALMNAIEISGCSVICLQETKKWLLIYLLSDLAALGDLMISSIFLQMELLVGS